MKKQDPVLELFIEPDGTPRTGVRPGAFINALADAGVGELGDPASWGVMLVCVLRDVSSAHQQTLAEAAAATGNTDVPSVEEIMERVLVGFSNALRSPWSPTRTMIVPGDPDQPD